MGILTKKEKMYYNSRSLKILLYSQNEIWGVTNPTPLTKISSSRFVRKGCMLILSQHICTNKNLSMMHYLLATHGIN
jgi:hypothetical protein